MKNLINQTEFGRSSLQCCNRETCTPYPTNASIIQKLNRKTCGEMSNAPDDIFLNTFTFHEPVLFSTIILSNIILIYFRFMQNEISKGNNSFVHWDASWSGTDLATLVVAHRPKAKEKKWCINKIQHIKQQFCDTTNFDKSFQRNCSQPQ